MTRFFFLINWGDAGLADGGVYGIFLFCLKAVDSETLRAAFFQNDLLCLYEMTALFSCCRLAGLNPFIKSVPYGRSILFV